MCSLGSQWKRSAGLLGRISSSWSVEIVWMHCCSCFRHGFTLFTWEHKGLSISLTNTDLICTSQLQTISPFRLVFVLVQHPGSAWPEVPGRRPSATPSGWGFPASFPQSSRTVWEEGALHRAFSPLAATTWKGNNSIFKYYWGLWFNVQGCKVFLTCPSMSHFSIQY